MSREAREWAWNQHVGHSPAKWVLVVLGDIDQPQGCFPSIETIAKITEQSVRTVQRNLDYLVANKLIDRVRSSGGKGQSNHYKLNIKPRHSDTVKPCQSATLNQESNPVNLSPNGVNLSSKPCQNDHLTDVNSFNLRTCSSSNARNDSIKTLRFEEFYQAYPRHQKKSQAKKIWIQKGLDAKADQIIQHVKERVKKDVIWLKDNGQYIPLPDTFLRNERWDDEYKITACTQPGAITKSLEPEEDD